MFSPKITLFKVVMIAAGLVCLNGGECAASAGRADRVVVIKSERRLLVFKGGEVLKSCRVSLGRQPVGHKTRRGDNKTPEGTYILDRRHYSSRFYRAIHISYPNEADRARARKEGASPGGDIMIHGLPRGLERIGDLHTVYDWTSGCIAVTNQEMDEIWDLAPNGTPVEIRP